MTLGRILTALALLNLALLGTQLVYHTVATLLAGR
jgi:hypothetical protein